jgi:hypothetical protein
MDKIIVLEMWRGTGQGDTTLRHLFRFAVPLARRVPTTQTSVYRSATAEDNAKLADGSEIEEVYEIQIPAGRTAAQVRNLLEARYAARETELSNLPNPNQYYGTKWDGTSWT